MTDVEHAWVNLVEGGVFQTWDAADQTWVNQGDVIDLDGRAKLCSWDPATSVCT